MFSILLLLIVNSAIPQGEPFFNKQMLVAFIGTKKSKSKKKLDKALASAGCIL